MSLIIIIIIIIITVAGVTEYVWILVDFFVILVINGIWLMLK